MKRGGLALTTVCILALLVVAKFVRPGMPSADPVVMPPAEPATFRELSIKVEFSRAGVGTAIATLLRSGGDTHSRVVLSGGSGKVEVDPECTQILIEAAGHLGFRGPIPLSTHLDVRLEVAGRDKAVFQSAAPRPATKGSPFCALRFIDTASGELLRGVRVELDGAEIGQSNNNGEISVAFEKLRAAREFRADLQGYQAISWPLNEAMVDELHVEPLLMAKVAR